MKKDYKTLSFFQRGKRRKAVLCSLVEPETPKEIAIACKISISNVSNALAELIKEGYVESLTPQAHTYKYFSLTLKGKKALRLLNSKN
jgi:DNA-binding MarR family transcriptional regulator